MVHVKHKNNFKLNPLTVSTNNSNNHNSKFRKVNSMCKYSAEITIGFTRGSNMVEEDVDDVIIICVEVKNNGTLEKPIIVQLDTIDGTAKGNYSTLTINNAQL